MSAAVLARHHPPRLQLLGEVDIPWISSVIDDAEAATGQPWHTLLQRWQALPPQAHPAHARAVIGALRRSLGGHARGAVPARRLRAQVLGQPALGPGDRSARLHEASASLGLEPSCIEALLWSDLPGERLVAMPQGRPIERDLCAAANLSIVQRALARAYEVRLQLSGNPREVMRMAALQGLIHTAHRSGEITVVELSGPLSLFHQTTVYGRALARLVPYLAWCDRFNLEARCSLGDTDAVCKLGSPVLLPPAPAPRRFDSAVERRLARELPRATSQWRLVREPEVIASGNSLLFPDFLLEHRQTPGRRWWIELVGFWTADYLAKKLARYHAAGLANLILCIDSERSVAPAEVPKGAHVVRYRRQVCVDSILQIVHVDGG